MGPALGDPKRQPHAPQISPTESPHSAPGAGGKRLSGSTAQTGHQPRRRRVVGWGACAAPTWTYVVRGRTPTPERGVGRNYTSQQAARPKAPRRRVPLRHSAPRLARPGRPSATHAHREPAPCWVSLKARAGVALRCDGGGCCERAEPEARRGPTGMLCCVSRRATGLGSRRAVVKCACLFLSRPDLCRRVRPEKRGREEGFEGRPVL